MARITIAQLEEKKAQLKITVVQLEGLLEYERKQRQDEQLIHMEEVHRMTLQLDDLHINFGHMSEAHHNLFEQIKEYQEAIDKLRTLLSLSDPRDRIVLTMCKQHPEVVNGGRMREQEQIKPQIQSSANPLLSLEGQKIVEDLLHSKKRIQAIKFYRELTRLGLKESKDAVDAMQVRLGLDKNYS